ncbi:hypothetical protein pipiens_005036 [Culex pipiens pipiens]|uniref:Cuticle protein n=1 Tax=Culex pipiens pipiens TaxID=38569 RepID=A0ABD1CCE6_CULPP
MKCIAAVVLVALAVAEASYIPPTTTTTDASAVHNAYQAPIVSAYNNHWNVPAAVTYNSGHYYDNYHGHSAAVIAAPVQHSATYVAANRGAVHKAPLAGHAVNQKSLNLAPAPGTW